VGGARKIEPAGTAWLRSDSDASQAYVDMLATSVRPESLPLAANSEGVMLRVPAGPIFRGSPRAQPRTATIVGTRRAPPDATPPKLEEGDVEQDREHWIPACAGMTAWALIT
jgi:hypothetical protein